MQITRGIWEQRSSRLLVLGIMGLSGLLGTVSAWWQDNILYHDSQRPVKAEVTTLQAPHVYIPDGFGTLAAFPIGTDGPLEDPTRRQARQAEKARQVTRALVHPTRSNIDCGVMKCIALTYDDGPSEFTSTLLSILRERQAVATFFVLGSKAEASHALIRQAVRQGNEIGNHTWSHPNLVHAESHVIRAEIDHTNNLLTRIIGKPITFFRPPMGEYDARVAAMAHMPLALWSVDPRDWHVQDPHAIYQRTVQRIQPGQVVLLHDTHASTIEASRIIIDELQRQGYVLVTLSELFDMTEGMVPQLAGHVLRYR